MATNKDMMNSKQYRIHDKLSNSHSSNNIIIINILILIIA